LATASEKKTDRIFGHGFKRSPPACVMLDAGERLKNVARLLGLAVFAAASLFQPLGVYLYRKGSAVAAYRKHAWDQADMHAASTGFIPPAGPDVEALGEGRKVWNRRTGAIRQATGRPPMTKSSQKAAFY
jgi:hypothetical protein